MCVYIYVCVCVCVFVRQHEDTLPGAADALKVLCGCMCVCVCVFVRQHEKALESTVCVCVFVSRYVCVHVYNKRPGAYLSGA